MEEKGTIYDSVRFIAIILVVLAHVTRMYTGLGVVTPVMHSRGLALLTAFIYAFHMPLFIFISGAVFGLCIEKGKYQKRVAFLAKKAKRLVLPYVVFGFCYVTPVMVALHFTSLDFWQYFWDGIVLSHNSRHLWYILALFFIFCLAILCRRFLTGRAAWVVFIASIALHFSAEYIPREFQLRAAASYQVYFFFGIIWNQYFSYITRFFRSIKIAPLFFSFLFCIIFLYGQEDILGKLVCAAAGIFVMLSLCASFAKQEMIAWSPVHNVIKNSYGIYFFHPMIIYILFKGLYLYHIPPLILSLGIFVFSFLLSYILTELVRNVHLGVIIGE